MCGLYIRSVVRIVGVLFVIRPRYPQGWGQIHCQTQIQILYFGNGQIRIRASLYFKYEYVCECDCMLCVFHP